MADSPGFGTLNYAILIASMAAMVGIGCLFAGKQKTTEDYFLAGRKMSWLVMGRSMFASITSAIPTWEFQGRLTGKTSRSSWWRFSPRLSLRV